MALLFTIIGFSVLILVHELGHFLAAKFFKVRVDEFGFGFPPRLFSWTRGETRYSVNALPFGGFVKIYGEDGETRTRSKTTNVSESTNNIRDIRVDSEHSDEFVALDRDKQKHVLNPSIRMVSEHSDVLVVSDRDRSFSAQPVWRRMVMVAAGVAANLAAAWLALSLVFMAGAPPHLLISTVAPSSPAAEAGLVGGDIVAAVAAGGRMLYDPVKADEFVAMVGDAAREGSAISLTVGAGKEAREVSLVPRVNPPEGEGRLGVGLAEIGVPRAPFFESFRSGAEETWALTKLITAGMVQFFGGVFQKPEVLKEVAGPVGVVVAAAQAGSLGFAYLLHFLGLISVNLVVLNIIPFPALDGGRALFLLIEKLKGSPLPVRFERAVNAAGFIFLLLLMVFVTVQDVGRL